MPYQRAESTKGRELEIERGPGDQVTEEVRVEKEAHDADPVIEESNDVRETAQELVQSEQAQSVGPRRSSRDVGRPVRYTK